jgi:hypothetical protein
MQKHVWVMGKNRLTKIGEIFSCKRNQLVRGNNAHMRKQLVRGDNIKRNGNTTCEIMMF